MEERNDMEEGDLEIPKQERPSPFCPYNQETPFLITCVSRGRMALATSPLGNSSREEREPLMGVCVLTWAWSPGRILPELPTPGPPVLPRLLVWLSRLWYSIGDCSAGAKRGTKGRLQQRQVLSRGALLRPPSHFVLLPKDGQPM